MTTLEDMESKHGGYVLLLVSVLYSSVQTIPTKKLV